MLNNPTENLENIAAGLSVILTRRDQAREKALKRCREVIRNSSLSIRAVHRREFDKARELLAEARRIVAEVQADEATLNELFNTSFIRDSEKEYAEAAFTLALATGEPIPEPESLNVDPAAYLNGLGESAGELRRYLLDSIRREDASRGEELLQAMDEIYATLVTVDFPDAITGGLRRTTDMVRGVLERTRSDLTLIMRQQALEQTLKNQ